MSSAAPNAGPCSESSTNNPYNERDQITLPYTQKGKLMLLKAEPMTVETPFPKSGQ